ncbi:unnamed protein product [Closterium sp. NIES-53]
MFRSSPVSGGRYVSQVRPEPRGGKDGGSDIDEGDSVHDEASSLLRSDARPFPTSVGVAGGIFGGSYDGGSGGGFRKGNRRLRTLAACAALVVAALVLAACAVVDVADAWLGFGETRRAAGLERCVPQDIPVPSLSEMTVEEKVGQMMQIDERALGYGGNITVYHIGSVLSGGGAWPQYAPNTPTAWADMVDNFQVKALNTRLRVPLLYGVDAVHGHNNVEGATIFPHHVGLGAAGNATLVEEIAAAVAKEVAATGVRWTFAPAVTVCLDPRWGRCYESYGADPGLVTELAIAEIRGWMKVPPEAGNFPGSVFMAPTAKHYLSLHRHAAQGARLCGPHGVRLGGNLHPSPPLSTASTPPPFPNQLSLDRRASQGARRCGSHGVRPGGELRSLEPLHSLNLTPSTPLHHFPSLSTVHFLPNQLSLHRRAAQGAQRCGSHGVRLGGELRSLDLPLTSPPPHPPSPHSTPSTPLHPCNPAPQPAIS